MHTETSKEVKAISKAQEEVWEWKETLAKETEHMSMRETIEYLLASSKETVEKIKAAQRAQTSKAPD